MAESLDKPLPNRKHPHRLDPKEYRIPDQIYLVSSRAATAVAARSTRPLPPITPPPASASAG